REAPEPLLVEPDIFHTPAVEKAVHHQRQPLHLRIPAGRAAVVKDDRSGAVLRQSPFDLPYELLALFLVGLARLPIDQLVHLGAAVAIIVQLGTASVKQVEILIGVGPASRTSKSDDIVLAHDPGKPV